MNFKLALKMPSLWNNIDTTSIGGVIDLLYNIIKLSLFIAGVAAVIFLIYGGILYITSAGESGKVKQAKDTIVNAILGLAIAIFAYGIVDYIARRF